MDTFKEDAETLMPANEHAEILIDDGTVVITNNEYRELVTKAAALDILASYIKATGEVNDEVVKAVTGTITAQPMVPQKELDDVWSYYRRLDDEKNKIKNELAIEKRNNKDLIEMLRQNHIGPYADEETEEEGGNG